MNTKNGRRYIGSANEVKKRMRTHKSQLNRNIHHITDFQKDWNEQSESDFEFNVLLKSEDDVRQVEQEFIGMYEFKMLYNLHPSAFSPDGFRWSEEARQRQSELFHGKGNPFYGKEHSKEFKETRQGVGNPNSKLTENDVIQIKSLLKLGKTQRSIAEQFGVSQFIISQIKNNKYWKHVVYEKEKGM